MCTLIDSFVGRQSDFADETVLTRFCSRDEAVTEVANRFVILNHENPGQFDRLAIGKIKRTFQAKNTFRIYSVDGCEYSWTICHDREAVA